MNAVCVVSFFVADRVFSRSLQRDIIVGAYEDSFVQGLRDHRITASVSKSWFDADSGNLCCSFRDLRVGKDLCHVSLASSCRADFGCVGFAVRWLFGHYRASFTSGALA